MCHVLVIEDDFLIADHLIQIVEGAGATSFAQAATQIEAVAEARRRLPEVILSDVLLAQGTGPAAVQAILAEHGHRPVIFVTGTPEACEPCEPPIVVLGKPVDEQALADTFRSLAPL